MLETEDIKCKIGALRVLREITVHPEIRRSITMMGGIEVSISILAESSSELHLYATEMLANLAKLRKARRTVRRCRGIPRLIDLLDVDASKVSVNGDSRSKTPFELKYAFCVSTGTLRQTCLRTICLSP